MPYYDVDEFGFFVEKPDIPPDMMDPVRCTYCQLIYDLATVHVTSRFVDCSVFTSPCCKRTGCDDRMWKSRLDFVRLRRT